MGKSTGLGKPLTHVLLKLQTVSRYSDLQKFSPQTTVVGGVLIFGPCVVTIAPEYN